MKQKKPNFPLVPVLIAVCVALGVAAIVLGVLFGRTRESLSDAELARDRAEAEVTELENELLQKDASLYAGAQKFQDIAGRVELTTEEENETETEEVEAYYNDDPDLGEKVTIIGDSITWLTRDLMKEKLPGVDIYSEGGKVFEYDNGDANPSGLSVIKAVEAAGDLREVVVFALGTNNRDSVSMQALNESMFEKLHDITGERMVYLVTNYDLRHPETYDRNNKAISDAAETYDDWYVIDWVAAVEETGDPESYIKDEGESAVGDMQVHPTDPEGYELWTDMIIDALRSHPVKEVEISKPETTEEPTTSEKAAPAEETTPVIETPEVTEIPAVTTDPATVPVIDPALQPGQSALTE